MSKPKSRHRKSTAPTESGTEESTQPTPSGVSVADAARQRLISEAAYFRAQRRNFVPGQELDDWLAAEAEVTQSFLDQRDVAAELH